MPKRHGVNVDREREKLEEIKRGGTRFWTPKEHSNLIRILPPYSGEDWYKETWFHFGIGVDRKPIACARRLLDEACYICEQVDELRKSEDPRDVELPTQIASRRRVFYNIIDLDDVESGVQIFSSGVTIFKELLMYVADPDWGDITDPEEGYDIVIEREGTGIDTKYTVRAKKNPTPLIDPALLEDLRDLDEMVEILEYEQVKAIYEGEEFVKEEKEKEPVKKRKESPAAQIEKVEVEEEGEEIEEKPCFAKDYNELDPLCLSCERRGDCRKEFFKASLEKRKPTKSSNITRAAKELKEKLKRKPRR
ncbi:hypothetical protein ES703_47926 [subsurface metagenome]